ncbi:Tn3 family transposase, partial [Deinococcus xianganensis]|uniref:Tn3 family transposase n=1 Tax=Deinococcus xianganensis TaxID=1507289 RepID=UPI00192632C3
MQILEEWQPSIATRRPHAIRLRSRQQAPRSTAQANRASGLNLVVAAIALWNTVHLQRALQQLRQQGEDVPDDLMQHVSPLAWEHIAQILHLNR